MRGEVRSFLQHVADSNWRFEPCPLLVVCCPPSFLCYVGHLRLLGSHHMPPTFVQSDRSGMGLISQRKTYAVLLIGPWVFAYDCGHVEMLGAQNDFGRRPFQTARAAVV